MKKWKKESKKSMKMLKMKWTRIQKQKHNSLRERKVAITKTMKRVRDKNNNKCHQLYKNHNSNLQKRQKVLAEVLLNFKIKGCKQKF